VLQILRRGSRAVLWVVIIGVGAVFVLYLGFQGGFAPAQAGGPVVGAGDCSFDGRELEDARLRIEEQYRQLYGNQFDAERARNLLVDAAGSGLLRSALLAAHGASMGLTVSGEEMKQVVRRGGWTREAAEQQFGSEKRFRERLRCELLADKAARLIRASVAVSEAEARDALRYQLEEVKIAAVKLDARSLPAPAEPPEGAAAALLERDPERVRKSYETRRSEFDRPEQARLRHILARFEPGDEAGKQAARSRIDAIRARVAGGADFADVALEASEDPVTKERGGDLGWIARGSVVKALDDAAFAQEIGALGEVIESPQGFHLLRVEERTPARVVPFEEAQAQVAADLAKSDAAAAGARAKAEELSKAIREGARLVDLAREQGLAILRPDAFRRRPDGYVAQIGIAPEIVTAAFALTSEQPADPTIHSAGENVFVLIELLEKKTPSDAELAQELGATRERALAERRAALEDIWLEALRERLAARGELVYDLAAFRE
jgi:peptidyl-prolyl cis-trans isomerase D